MAAMRSTALGFGDIRDHIQDSFSPLRRVWNQLVPISIRDDPVRWTRSEVVFDQEAISQELHGIGDARPTRWAAPRLQFNRYENIGSLNKVRLSNKPIS